MQDNFISGPESISLLYGDVIYIVPEDETDSIAVKPDAEQPLKEKAVTKPTEDPKIAPPLAQETTQVPQNPSVNEKSASIQWRQKPGSKLLFILQQTELKDPMLTEFLKKIVDSIGIPFESAGFGIISGPVNLRQFEEMPNRYGIVFDGDLWMNPNVATHFGDNEVYFAPRLVYLQNDAESKRQLWSYLKNLKDILK